MALLRGVVAGTPGSLKALECGSEVSVPCSARIVRGSLRARPGPGHRTLAGVSVCSCRTRSRHEQSRWGPPAGSSGNLEGEEVYQVVDGNRTEVTVVPPGEGETVPLPG